MTSRIDPLLLAAALVAAGLGGAVASAGETAGPVGLVAPVALDETLDDAIARLGAAPTADAVRLAARSALRAPDAAAAHRLVLRLRGGGYPCSIGLVVLARHERADVRAAALRALGAHGVRLSEGHDALRAALRDPDPAVVRAGCEAAGRVGDARDLPALLDLLFAGDATTGEASRRALAALAGLPPATPASVLGYWSRDAKEQGRQRLDAAVDAMAGGRDCDVGHARGAVARSAWIAPERAAGVAQRCLRAASPCRRAEGLRLAADARIGEMADEVLSALRYETDGDVLAAARAAAAALGIPSGDGLPVEAEGDEGPTTGPAVSPPPVVCRGARTADPRPARAEPNACVPVRALDARLVSAYDHLAARRCDGVRPILDAVARGDDETSRVAARKGYVALYWTRRIADAALADAAAYREEARRALRSTCWAPLFAAR
jgi:hypothetical protein